MNVLQVARSPNARVYVVPRQPNWPSPVVLKGDDEGQNQKIYLEVVTDHTSWQLRIDGFHRGTPSIPICAWDRFSCIAVGLNTDIHFLATDSGALTSKREMPDELYISDMLVDPTTGKLVVATGRSLFYLETPTNVTWKELCIAEDGVSIRHIESGEAVVVCENPGDVQSVRRFPINQST